MSGVIPQVAALMGPCAAGTAYIPGLADFVPMVKGRGSMALAGPHLVRAAIGEDVTQEELGGSRVHCRKSGVGDLEVDSDEECIQAIKDYLSFFPSHCEEPPPRREVSDPVERADEELLDVLPESNRKPYDMYDVIRRDRRRRRVVRPQAASGRRRSSPAWRGSAAGRSGIVASPAAPARRHPRQRLRRQGRALRQPLQRVRDPARVPAWTCRASWSAPRSRRPGSSATARRCSTRSPTRPCPKITVVIRKAYGAGYYVMNGRAYEPDLIVAWPSAEISVMGAEGAVEIVMRTPGRGGRRPGRQEGRADRRLPQDHRRLHRGRATT